MNSTREMQHRLLELVNENKILVGLIVALLIAAPTGAWMYFENRRTASEDAWYRLSQINKELVSSEQANARDMMLSETIGSYINLKTNQSTTEVTPWLLLRLGIAQFDAGKFDDAIDTYSELIKGYSRHSAIALARLSLGCAYEEKGMMQDALQQFEAIEVEDNPFIKTQRALDMGRCYEKLGATEEAKRAYNEAIEHSPGTNEARLAQFRLESFK